MTESARPTPPAKERINTRAAGIIGIAVMCSRVLGLIRETLFAALFGGGREMDVFIAAFRIPNLLRDLFAEGALSTAFVTTFTKRAQTEGDESGDEGADRDFPPGDEGGDPGQQSRDRARIQISVPPGQR